MYGYEMTAAGWFWMIAGLIVLVATILAAAWVVARAVRSPAAPQRTPLEILQERFARGELSAEDYEKARSLLR